MKKKGSGKTSMKSYKYQVPAQSIFGYGCLELLGDELKERGYKNALIVTDKGICDLGIADKLINVLDNIKLNHVLFNQVKPNPTTKNVYDGIEVLKKNKCDCVITIGGGSAHDCGKAISIISVNGGKVQDYIGLNQAKKKGVDIIAINTTAGTGSECTQAYVISDEEIQSKYGIRDKFAQAAIAVDDYELMMGLPKSLTAGTGMDALTHAVECLVSINSFVLTEELALAAIRLIFKHLEEAVNNPKSYEAREGMAVGQYLAGLAFGNGGVGLVHSMSHQLSAVYDLPHGLSNAILLPEVMKFNKKASIEKLAEMGKMLAPKQEENTTDEQFADIAIEKIIELSKAVGTRIQLRTLGVKREDFSLLAEKTLKDGSIRNTPVKPTMEEIIEIYESVF